MHCPLCPTIYDIRTKCYFFLSQVCFFLQFLCAVKEGYFSTIWKYSQLNLEELRGRAVPTFPCLKFPSNGVIPSLSFPFYTWVGETSAHCGRGRGLDRSSSLDRAAGCHGIVGFFFSLRWLELVSHVSRLASSGPQECVRWTSTCTLRSVWGEICCPRWPVFH